MRALEPFANRNFSLYFASQVLSNVGTWFQNLALALMLLDVTGRAQVLGYVTAAQFLPLLLLSIPAGWLADRVSTRRILLITMAASSVVVAAIAFVVRDPQPDITAIYLLVMLLGVFHTFERIAGQAFIFEIVGGEGLSRAVSISTIAMAAARTVGPGLAGVAYDQLGPFWALMINALSFLVGLLLVLLINRATLRTRTSQAHSHEGRGASGGRHSWRDLVRVPEVRVLLGVNVTIALLSLNLMLVLTAMATMTLQATGSQVGLVHALNAVGSVAGGLYAASRFSVSARALAPATAAFGVCLAVASLSPSLFFFFAVGPFLGFGVGYYHGVLHAASQKAVVPSAIGRMMSLITLGSFGVAPLGALLMGWVVDEVSPRGPLVIGAVAALGCAAAVSVYGRRQPASAGGEPGTVA